MIRKTIKKILTDSFIEPAQHKPVNKITVADVTSNCGMAAPTFRTALNSAHAPPLPRGLERRREPESLTATTAEKGRMIIDEKGREQCA